MSRMHNFDDLLEKAAITNKNTFAYSEKVLQYDLIHSKKPIK